MSDDDDRLSECDWYGNDPGLCNRPHLVEGQRFSIKLDETFNVEMVRNDDKCSFIIKHDFYFVNV